MLEGLHNITYNSVNRITMVLKHDFNFFDRFPHDNTSFLEHHEQELFKQKIRNLRYIEIRLMQGMGYTSQTIEHELGLSRRRIKDTLMYQKKRKKDREIRYLLEVLETIQEIAVTGD
ncbi:hypothetical protein [Desulfitobacterium sp.]|uniref:hypothetical protein n=1 Tax=Desulfitobacterium sp. TaxID=49981 RepID=UPI002BFF2EC6|nr:hypothetical protein [Desulfitobacterium sp.]HVJ49251.1 hypothetical protein [Desulfitobacterium sp.]